MQLRRDVHDLPLVFMAFFHGYMRVRSWQILPGPLPSPLVHEGSSNRGPVPYVPGFFCSPNPGTAQI